MTTGPEPEAAKAVWIFGYGSLMWRPGFEAVETVQATVHGWRRAFCIYSTHHRGNHRRPGLVLALDRGGSCRGVAFRLAPGSAPSTLAYLRAREQVNGVYREAHVTARLDDGTHREITAIAYVAERRHPSWTGPLPLARQVELIRAARGLSGTNVEYLINTLSELERLGVRERDMERIRSLIGPHFAGEPRAANRWSALPLIACCRRFPVRAPLMAPMERRRFTHRRKIAEWALPRKPGN